MEAKLVITTPSQQASGKINIIIVFLREGKTGRRQVFFFNLSKLVYKLDTAWREIWVMHVALLQPDLLAVKLKNTKL